MDKREILQQIIDNNGSCDWIGYSQGGTDKLHKACSICPLGKLKQRPDGSYYGCWEALVRDEANAAFKFLDADKLYLDKATEILQDILVEDMLTGEMDDESKPR